jgi:hypothetical protein
MINIFKCFSYALISSAIVYGAVGGKVYLELPATGSNTNTYGVKDTNEPGIAGVKVVVTDSSGASEEVTTGADGSWSSTLSAPVRVEFKDWPAYLDSAPYGGGSATSVQFVGSDSSDINFGLHDVNDYTGSATPDYVTNIALNGSNIGLDVMDVVVNHYADNGLNSDFTNKAGDQGKGPNPRVDAKGEDVGSVWGEAYNSSKKNLYISSVLQRHVGFANGNPGRVWILDYSAGSTPSTHYIDLQGVSGIDLGSITRVNSGDGSTDNGLPDDATTPNHDLDAYAKAGKISFGDIEYDAKNNMLYAINLNQKALIQIDVSGINVASNSVDSSKVKQFKLTDLGAPTCSGGEFRPWGLSIHQGKVFIGAVCDASTSQNFDDLKAYVLSFDPKNPTTLSKELEYSLKDKREDNGLYLEDLQYFPWSDKYHDGTNGKENSAGNEHNVETENWDGYNQPIVSDIAFDENNNMYLNIMDRYSLQIGYYQNPAYSGSGNTKEKNYGAGALKKVCFVNGAWEVESKDSATCPAGSADGRKRSTEENFFEDYGGDNNNHEDGSGIAIVKGSKQLIRTMVDPHPNGETGKKYWVTNGTVTFSLDNGDIENWYSHYKANRGDPYAGGKAGGMGDIEFLTVPAPIEVGNRVWDDTNANGIQDAQEAGIAGVKVQLVCNGAVVAEVTTDSNGNYIFSNDPNGNDSASKKYNINKLQPNNPNSCLIRIPNYKSQTPLSGKVLSANNQANDIQIDSNGVDKGGNDDAVISPAEISNDGANNHTYDFGFTKPQKACLGDFVWEDTNKNGIQDAGEKGVAGVVVYLIDNGVLKKDKNATTDSNGKYSICNLDEGTYDVKFDLNTLPKGYVVTAKDQGGDETKDSDANPSSGETKKSAKLKAGDNDTTFDMGIYKMPCLGDFVWEDTNKNGIQDAGEKGVKDVNVTLYNSSGNIVGSVKTDANGKYKFCELKADKYKVVFDPKSLPSDYIITSQNSGNDDAKDSDSDNQGVVDNIAIDKDDDYKIDMGIYKANPKVKIEKSTNGKDADSANQAVEVDVGSIVTWEYNVTNSGSEILTNFKVTDDKEATNGIDATNCKDSSGAQIADLESYELKPNDWFKCTLSKKVSKVESYENNAKVTAKGKISGKEVNSTDPSHYKVATYSIGSIIWDDKDKDNKQSSGDSGLSGAKVELLTCNKEAVAGVSSITTNSSGLYKFSNLVAGEYIVKVTSPSGYVPIKKQSSSDDNIADDSNIASSSSNQHYSACIKLSNNQEPSGNAEKSPITTSGDDADDNDAFGDDNGDMTIDFGFYKPPTNIELEKCTKGGTSGSKCMDADKKSDDKPIIEVGKEVIWEYTITNSGGEDLKELKLKDETENSEVTECKDENGTKIELSSYILKVGDSITCTLKGTAVAGEYENNATVNAKGVITGTPIDDKDPSHYYGSKPSIDLEKSTNGKDADKATDSDVPTIVAGKRVVWEYNVTNNGNVKLTNLVLEDNIEGTIKCPKNELDVNESIICKKEGIAKVEDGKSESIYENNATVTAKAPTGEEVNDTDPSHYKGVKPACLGNRVWLDSNANGIQDSSEGADGANGVKGATVELLFKDGTKATDYNSTVLKKIVTDDSGLYEFCNLEPNREYRVKITPPSGYYLSPKDSGSDDSKDSDIDPTTKESSNTKLSPGEKDYSLDAGVYKPACLGDYTWLDENVDGLQDKSEKPLEGVKVTLLDKSGNVVTKDIDGNKIDSKKTDANGKYEFCNLIPGDYKVSFQKEPDSSGAPYITTKQDAGDDKSDSDVDEYKNAKDGAESSSVRLQSGDNNTTLDAGFIQEICLGDYVWEDKNANGVQEDGEEPIAKVGVSLYMKDSSGKWIDAKDVQGNIISKIETNATGGYKFCHLKPAQDYKIVFDKVADKDNMPYYISPKDSSDTNDSKDSDINEKREIEVKRAVKDDMSLDAGFFRPACIGDKVWLDENANGIQEDNEMPISGAKVRLYLEDGKSIAKRLDGSEAKEDTNRSGNYHICNLRPGKYIVEISKPDGSNYYFTRASSDADLDKDNKNSDSNIKPELKDAVGGRSVVVELSSGEDDLTWDAGMFEPACIGDYIWEDKDANGIQDKDERGVNGVKVTLVPLKDEFGNINYKDVDGKTIGSMDTNATGGYKYCQLIPGKYQVKVTTPDGYLVTRENTTDDSKDSDIDGFLKSGTLSMPEERLSSGENNMTFDGGIFKPACLGDFAFKDENADGIQDDSDTPLDGVHVTIIPLKDASGYTNTTDVYGNTLGTKDTDANGKYEFCNLIPGDYKVHFKADPDSNGAPYITTKQDATDDNNDSDLPEYVESEGDTPKVTLQSGDNNTTLDAGFIQEICLGDKVWLDENLNGIQDEDKGFGVVGVNVTLYDKYGNIAKDVQGNVVKAIKTDKNGYYKFCHLRPAQDYKIKFEIPNTYNATLKDRGSDVKDSDADRDGWIYVKSPVRDDMTLDMGIYCDCEDWEVHPEDYKELKAPALSLIGGALAILTLVYFVARREEDSK